MIFTLVAHIRKMETSENLEIIFSDKVRIIVDIVVLDVSSNNITLSHGNPMNVFINISGLLSICPSYKAVNQMFGKFYLKKKERRKGENSKQILICSAIFLCVIFLQDVCWSNIFPSSTVVLNRWEAACFLSESIWILVLGAVCLVGSDFIETKSK